MEGIPGIPAALTRRAEAAAAWIGERQRAGDVVAVAHHIDADGLAAGAIALECLQRAGVEAVPIAARSLDDLHLAKIGDAVGTRLTDAADEEAVGTGGPRAAALWFCDFGSTAYMHFDVPRLVCDHHELVRDGSEEEFAHLNPLLDDLPGDTISGAGCSFLAAYAHDPENLDLLPLALVGATGDLQDRNGGFSGANEALLRAGADAGLIETHEDLAWFGPETRPLRKFLAYGEPAVPGVTRDMRGAEALLVELGVPLHEAGQERTWGSLSRSERVRVRSALAARQVDCGLESRVQDLWRPVVRIPHEAPGPTRELQEFGTLLNSTARYGEPEVGLAVARGDRDDAFQRSLGLRDGHRQNLVKSLDAFRDVGIQESSAVQWVHLEDRVRDTVLGIVCGMALDGLGLRRDMPLVGFAFTPEGDVKVSSRAPHEIQGRVDLATAMREAAAAVGGQGGGHKGAAGASIPRAEVDRFLAAVDSVMAQQLGIPVKPASRAAVQAAVQPAAVESTADTQATEPAASAAIEAMDSDWRPRRGQNTLF